MLPWRTTRQESARRPRLPHNPRGKISRSIRATHFLLPFFAANPDYSKKPENKEMQVTI
jgi:hypothetical protein